MEESFKASKKLLALIAAMSICLVAVWYSKKPLQTTEPDGQAEAFKMPVMPKPKPVMSKEEAKNAITAASCRELVVHLCSDEYEGRMTGHPGNMKASRWIHEKFENFGLEPKYQMFPWTAGVNPGPNNEQGTTASSNVMGVLRGTSDRHIIVGAHFDHLGYGPRGSRWGAGKIHPGADDNATGTTLVLELARAMDRMKYKPKHTIIFIAFSGEEMGLVGSQYYVKNPYLPLLQLDFMFNTDMIGRMNGKETLNVGGSEKLNKFMEKLNKTHPIKMKASGGAGGGSDHAPFAERNIPCCCFHSGMHDDYHTPSDTPDRIDYEGMYKVVRYVFELVIEFDQN